MFKAILDLLKAIFLTRTIYQVPKEVKNELEGKPLRYLIGQDFYVFNKDSITEVGYDYNFCPTDALAIGYCNLFDEKNTGKYGPYINTSDTAREYNEGQVDPKGSGWERNLDDQFRRRKASGFNYIELDNPDAYNISDVIRAVEQAGKYGLRVIAKNPGICDSPLTYVKHPNIYGIIVEKDCGTPEEMERLRRQAGKPTLPVWFVCFTSGRSWGDSVAASAVLHRNMGVTYSPNGAYTTSVDLVTPHA